MTTKTIQSRELKSIDKTILDNFYKLVHNEEHVRLRAATSTFKILSSFAKNKTLNFNDNLNYCIERLVAGLASSRACARKGYSVLLMEILDSYSVSTERLMSIAEHKFGNLNREAVIDNLVGYFLLAAIILKTGNLTKSKANSNHTDRLYKLMLKLWELKSYFECPIADLIIEHREFLHACILSHIPPNAFASDSKISPHDFLLILICNKLKPIKQLIEMERNDIMRHAQLLKNERILRKPLHPLLVETCAFFAQHRPNMFDEFYCDVIMPTMFVKNHNEKASLGLELSAKLLADPRIDESCAKSILNEHVIRILYNVVRVREQLHRDCIQFLNIIRDFFMQPGTERKQIMILKCLIAKNANDILIENLLKVASMETAEVYLKGLAQIVPKKKLPVKQASIVGTRVNFLKTNSLTPLLNKLFEDKKSLKVWKNYTELLKSLSDIENQRKLVPITIIFFIHALQMVEHEKEPVEQIEELYECAKRALKEKSKKNWADVLTDQIISILSSTDCSVWYRKLCVQAFRKLLPHISIEAVQLITDVIKSNGEDEDGEDIDDDEEEEEDDDDDDEIGEKELKEGDLDSEEEDESMSIDGGSAEDNHNDETNMQIDVPTEKDDSDNDSEEYLDDDAMMKLDPLIVDMFKANRKSNDADFRLRCLDLVDCIVKKGSDEESLKLVASDLHAVKNCSKPITTKLSNIMKSKKIQKYAKLTKGAPDKTTPKKRK